MDDLTAASDKVSSPGRAISVERPSVGVANWGKVNFAHVVLLAGVLIRVWAYTADRPVWIDEAVLADNILDRSFARLIEPLAHHQAAPAGFLWIERLAVEILGPSEQALRLFPLLAGIAGLLALDATGRRVLSPVGRLAATSLFAVGDSLIYYCQEVKPYGVDAAAACVFFWLSVRLVQGGWKSRDLAVLTGAGALLMWLSLPFVFVACGVLACVLYASRSAPSGLRTSAGVAAAGAVIAGSFLLHYLLVIAGGGASDTALNDYWTARGGFLPLPPRRLKDLATLVTLPLDFFTHPMGFRFAGIAVVLAAIGVASSWRRLPGAVMLLAPLVVALAAVVLKKYPFPVHSQHTMAGGGRLLLFAVPGLLLLIGAGADRLCDLTGRRGRLVVGGLVVMLAMHPLLNAVQWIRSIERPDVRDALAHLAEHQRTGDVVHASWAAHQMAAFYRHRFELGDTEQWIGGKFVVVRDQALTPAAWVKLKDWNDMQSEIAPLQGRRVWFFIFHEPSSPSREDEKFLLFWLSDKAILVDRITTADTSLHLYEIKSPPR